jgi:hypothetical protein
VDRSAKLRGGGALVALLLLALLAGSASPGFPLARVPAAVGRTVTKALHPGHKPTPPPADPAAEAGASGLALGDVPRAYLALYHAAASTCPKLTWQLLAGIGKVETNHGRGWPPRWRTTPGITRGTENYAGAGGPMQFLAPTWTRWGRGGDRWDYRDAIPAAARKLCADGVAHGDLPTAVFAYNHSGAYVNEVLALARRYQAGGGR